MYLGKRGEYVTEGGEGAGGEGSTYSGSWSRWSMILFKFRLGSAPGTWGAKVVVVVGVEIVVEIVVETVVEIVVEIVGAAM